MHHSSPKNLADFLIKTVSDELLGANIGIDKLNNLNTQFAFISTDTTLSTRDNALKELIDEIDENINTFIKTHEYFDVLGQLYIEFLRYANADKGLGIVLTPPHITDFFAEIAGVNKQSIIYDNCTGTGGFLISGMNLMIKDAKGDSEKIKSIKSSQLIGTEYQSHIYALAVSNMFIHQDGKTSIINGSCFDHEIIKNVKSKKPTIGLLNPPYKAEKKSDTEELQFVLNNLECLSDGGTCVAIIPMQCALSQSGKVYELKKELLRKHTLEAVLSMPDELFFNSKVNVVTCIMVFTAHRKHPEEKEVFLGYFKDDGFDKRKYVGRIDVRGRWPAIKKYWLSAFRSRKEVSGLSVKRILNAKDEWCAETYMQTDYSRLNLLTYENVVREFIAFQFVNKRYPISKINIYLNIVSEIDVNKKNIKAVSKETKYVPLHEKFTLTYGCNMELYKLDECDKDHDFAIPFVSRTEKNNGVSAFVETISMYMPNPENTLSVAGGGSVLATFFQPEPYYSGRDLYYLTPHQDMSVSEMLYYSMIIKSNAYKYSYGRQANKTLKDLFVPETMPSEFELGLD